jgi:hypothetical protein
METAIEYFSAGSQTGLLGKDGGLVRPTGLPGKGGGLVRPVHWKQVNGSHLTLNFGFTVLYLMKGDVIYPNFSNISALKQN